MDPALLECAAQQTASEWRAALIALCQVAVGKLPVMLKLLFFI